MKGKILWYAVMLSITTTVANARPDYPSKSVNAKASNVIEAFVDAHTHADAALFNAILNSSAILKLNRQDEVVTHTKSQLVTFYKRVGLMNLNCSSGYEVLSSSECVVMARVDFKFPEFVQQNYVTIEKDKKGLWKITQINRFSI
ncbi:hypothetical protein [Pedobacter ginsengisoli]|uniref:hypothetical protein n=1 Tax=Pedobacter ginsengisoli TaxID=363852 RepID=UPI00254B3EFC|nr:hypothetical protein [Pedobacter ginsengisoli]